MQKRSLHLQTSSLPIQSLQPSSIVAQQGINSDSQFGSVMPPLHLSSNFSFSGIGQPRHYDYTRTGNPTRDQLAEALAELEKGSHCVVTSTGMSAATLILQLLKPDDLLLAPDDCYGGCHRLFQAKANQGHFRLKQKRFTSVVDLIRVILEKHPKMVWIETPSNPLLRVTDIETIASVAHEAGALVVVDNTFLSPIQQQPLSLGADIVMHSNTKYINGHSDVVGGSVITSDIDLGKELAWWANCLGITGAPFDSFLTLRGLRTLPLRIKQHQKNALAVAQFLDSRPEVSKVYYPGLTSDEGYELAKKQQLGFGGIVTFELQSDIPIDVFVDSLQLFTLAESLGGVESLIAHPATMTHAVVPPEARAKAGISDGLLRLSLGVEATEDLIDDFKRAFEAVEHPDYIHPTQLAS